MTVTMLSRGKGVPDATRAAYRDIRALLEARQKASVVTDMRSQRIGLEGETRMCAQFRSAQDARAAYDEIRKRASGVDLLQVALTPCPSPKDYTP